MSQSIPTEDRISSLEHSFSVTFFLFSQPNPLQPQASSLGDRIHYGSLFPLSTLTMKPSKHTPPFASLCHLSRDITLPLRSFHLKCSDYSINSKHDINRFVYSAVQRGGLENINLDMSNKRNLTFKLHPRIFSCKTLVVLQLNMISMDALSHVVVDFPRLKTLHLSDVFFQRVEYLVGLRS
jgi:hypothetical protein